MQSGNGFTHENARASRPTFDLRTYPQDTLSWAHATGPPRDARGCVERLGRASLGFPFGSLLNWVGRTPRTSTEGRRPRRLASPGTREIGSALFAIIHRSSSERASRPGRGRVASDPGDRPLFAGPIIAREVLTAPRPLRFYVARASYVGLLFILMWTAWQSLIGWRDVKELGVIARFGGVLYGIFAFLQLTLILFFAPLLTAASIAHEKDRRTFLLLLMTDLSDLEIVLGKMVAALAEHPGEPGRRRGAAVALRAASAASRSARSRS